MIINFKNLQKGKTLELNKTYSFDELDIPLGEIDLYENKVFVNVKLERKSNFVSLILRLHFSLNLVCSRCLEEFRKDFEIEEEFFLKKGEEVLSREKSLSNEDIYTIYYQEEIIDITPLVRDTVILARPLKPLCREDCKGLCPVCGVNWNYKKCEHYGKRQESVFGLRLKEALKQIRR